MSQARKDLLLLVFATLIVAIIIKANQAGTLGAFRFLVHIPHFDKIGHFVLMGLLAFLMLQTFVPRMKADQRRSTRRIVVVLLLLIALEEGSQAFNPNRSFSIADYLFSTAGVLLAAVAFSLSTKKPRQHDGA